VWSIGEEFRCQRNWAALESLILQNSIGLYVLDGNGTNGRTTTSHGCNYRSWLARMNKPYSGPAPLSLLEMELRPNFGTTAGCRTRALGRWHLTCTDWHGGKHHRRQSHGLEKLDERTLGVSATEEIQQFVTLWQHIHSFHLTDGEDEIVRKFSSSGNYSSRSAYRIQFAGTFPDF
jgi:hypothetical protein